ncbi:hypothetical protein ACFQL0_15615 [Haloplanus litoreus]|uniref:hypothetical protein n=1 Tax=Haloplanus litoreus TaxID=767515 RepID=UPI00360C813B
MNITGGWIAMYGSTSRGFSPCPDVGTNPGGAPGNCDRIDANGLWASNIPVKYATRPSVSAWISFA